LTYEELLNGYEIKSLNTRKKISLILFLNKILTSQILDSDLLNKINIQIPRTSSRSSKLFKIPKFRTEIYKNSPIIKSMILSNLLVSKHPDADLLDPRARPHLIAILKRLNELHE